MSSNIKLLYVNLNHILSLNAIRTMKRRKTMTKTLMENKLYNMNKKNNYLRRRWSPTYPNFLRPYLCIIFRHPLSKCGGNNIRKKQERRVWKKQILLRVPGGDVGTTIQRARANMQLQLWKVIKIKMHLSSKWIAVNGHPLYDANFCVCQFKAAVNDYLLCDANFFILVQSGH